MSEMSLTDRILKATAHMTSEDADAVRGDLETVHGAGITSIEQLVEAVGDPSRESSLRAIACVLLATLKEKSATAALAHALEEGPDGLEWEAAKALMRLRAESAAPTLVRVLEQGTPSKQSAAAYALGWLQVPSTIPALRAAAVDAHLDVEVRGHATEALGVMQAREAVPDLVALLSDESPELRYWAAYSLGQIGDPASIPELERVAANDAGVLFRHGSVKQEALEALATIRASDRDRT